MFSLGARGVRPQRWARGWKPEALPARLPLPGKHWGTLRPRGPWGGAPIQAPFTAIPPGSLGPHPARRGGPDAAPAPLRVGPGGTRKGAAGAAEFREEAESGLHLGVAAPSLLRGRRTRVLPGLGTGRAAERPALNRARRRVPAAARPPRAEREPGSPRAPRGDPCPEPCGQFQEGAKPLPFQTIAFCMVLAALGRSPFRKEAGYHL